MCACLGNEASTVLKKTFPQTVQNTFFLKTRGAVKENFKVAGFTTTSVCFKYN